MRYINLHLVHSLQVLLQESTFSRAATRLHITAPAMTQRIHRLEESVGYALVVRGHHPIRLSPRGERFMLHAREALEASNLALGERQKNVLRIGFIEGYPRSQNEDFLVRFKRHNADIDLEFVQLDWSNQITRLLTGDVDAVLARSPFENEEAIERITVFREPRVVAVPADSALAGQRSLVLDNIDGLPVVGARGVAREWTKYWVIDPRPSGTPVKYGAWVGTIEEALTAVAMSKNIMVTAESVATRYAHPGVSYLLLDDVPYCQVELCTCKTDRRTAVRALRLSAESVAS